MDLSEVDHNDVTRIACQDENLPPDDLNEESICQESGKEGALHAIKMEFEVCIPGLSTTSIEILLDHGRC